MEVADAEVLTNRHVHQETLALAVFGNQGDAEAHRPPSGCGPAHLGSVDDHLAAGGWLEAGDCPEEGRTTGSHESRDSEHLAWTGFDRDPIQNSWHMQVVDADERPGPSVGRHVRPVAGEQVRGGLS